MNPLAYQGDWRALCDPQIKLLAETELAHYKTLCARAADALVRARPYLADCDLELIAQLRKAAE